jgi:hypothetical protein
VTLTSIGEHVGRLALDVDRAHADAAARAVHDVVERFLPRVLGVHEVAALEPERDAVGEHLVRVGVRDAGHGERLDLASLSARQAP